MATVTTDDIRLQNARNLVSSLSGSYTFIGKPTPWALGNDAPPAPKNNIEEFYDTCTEMMSLKKISSSDVYHMITRIPWTSGIIYDMYRHDYSSTNTAYSGTSNLYNSNFIVINQNNDVYVCLFNASNQQSTVEPQNTGDNAFYTSDGYQWLKLYSLTQNQSSDYVTSNLMPVVNNEVVTTTSGAINTVVINSVGLSYTTSPAGVINQIPYYFCNITGDGRGAVARVTVTNGSISEVVVVRSGSGYSYGTLEFEANKVYENLADLDNATNGLNPLGDGTFTSTVIISPPSGWGTDLIRETGATRVGVFTTLNYNQSDFTSDVSFRQVGILGNVASSPSGSDTLSAYYSIKVTILSGTSFTVGEKINQTVTVVQDGVDVSKVANGTIVGWDPTNGIVRFIQNPKTDVDSDGYLYKFAGAGYVTGLTSGMIVSPETDYDDVLQSSEFFDGYAEPEYQRYSGNLIYLTNNAPILRQQTQTETISLIISY